MEIAEPRGDRGDEGGGGSKVMVLGSTEGQLLVRCMVRNALSRRVGAGSCGTMKGFSHACAWRSWRVRRLLGSCRR